MKNKTFWMGFVAIFILLQAISYFLHEVIMADAYEPLATVFRPEAEMMSMMYLFWISGAILLFFFCLIFTRGYEGKGVMEGVRYGALIGGLYAVPVSIDSYTTYPLPVGVTVIWAAFGVVTFVILGAVFAAIYKPGGS